MYFLGLCPGDVDLNVSSPGWAKHAWSSSFAPWVAESTILVYYYTRFDAPRCLAMLQQAAVTSLCAPPTKWRMLIQADLGAKPRETDSIRGIVLSDNQVQLFKFRRQPNSAGNQRNDISVKKAI